MSQTQAQVKAWAFNKSGYPDCLHKTSLPTPAPPTASQMLVRTQAAALNPVDIQLMNMSVWSLPFPPFSGEKGICHDFAGTVLVAGSDCGFKAGDEVFGVSMWIGAGTCQEVAPIDTKSGCVIKKPPAWSWEQAAALPVVWLTARTIIEVVAADVEAGKEKKLVVLGGSSATGMYAVHIAKQRGWKVLSTCSGRNTDFVKSMGANEVVDYTKSSVPAEVKRFAPDAILDCVGGTECIGLAKNYCTIVGDKTTRTSMGGALTYLWQPQMVLRALMGWLGFGNKYSCTNISLRKEWLQEALNVPQEKIVIDSSFSFDQVKEALERLNTGRARGKVIIKVPS